MNTARPSAKSGSKHRQQDALPPAPQADDESWKAMGDQLIAEEEQAAARAAAKKARKQKQKAQRQSTTVPSSQIQSSDSLEPGVSTQPSASQTSQADSVLPGTHIDPKYTSPEPFASPSEMRAPTIPTPPDQIPFVPPTLTPPAAPPFYSYSAAQLLSLRPLTSLLVTLTGVDIPDVLSAYPAAAASCDMAQRRDIPFYSSAGNALPTQPVLYQNGTNHIESSPLFPAGTVDMANQKHFNQTRPGTWFRKKTEHSAWTSASAESIAKSGVLSVQDMPCSTSHLAKGPEPISGVLQALLCCPITKVSPLLW